MQPTYTRSSAIVIALFLSILPGSGYAQSSSPSPSPSAKSGAANQPQTVFKSTTRLVVLDVVVTDDKGQPVTGLKSEDFTVKENGEPQNVIDFSFHTPGNIAQSPSQPGILTNTPLYRGQSCLNVILLDAINTDFSSHAYAQDMLIKYLDSGPAIQPTAVYALEGNLVMLHDFTTDTKGLRDVVAHFQFQGPEHIPDVCTAD